MTAVLGLVIATYKQEKFIGSTIASLRGQDYPHWRCAVVDDGSPDGTFAAARAAVGEDSRFQVVTKQNGGVASTRNHGYDLIRGGVDYISFMDGDDVWLDGALSKLLAKAEQTPAGAGSHGVADMIDENDQPYFPGEFAKFNRARYGLVGGVYGPLPGDAPTTLSSVAFGSTLYPPGILLVRRHVQDQAGPFRTGFKYACEDWDMLIRVARQGDLGFVDQIIVGYRRHRENGSNEAVKPRAIRALNTEALTSPENSPLQAEALRKTWRGWQAKKVAEDWTNLGSSLRKGGVSGLSRGAKEIGKLGGHALQFVAGRPLFCRRDDLFPTSAGSSRETAGA